MEACHLATKVDCTVKQFRFCERISYCENNPALNTSDCFKFNVSVPFIDHMLQELSQRFSERNSVMIRRFSIIPKCHRLQYVSTFIGERERERAGNPYSVSVTLYNTGCAHLFLKMPPQKTIFVIASYIYTG